MKRLWIGVGVLAAVLAAGIWLNLWMDSLHDRLARELDKAGDLALAQQWQAAEATAQAAREQWLRNRRLLAAVVDHEPLEEMERLFSQLEVYRRQRWSEEFAVTCSLLARQAEAVGDSHSLTWWNFF